MTYYRNTQSTYDKEDDSNPYTLILYQNRILFGKLSCRNEESRQK